MAFDGITVAAVTEELNQTLVGGRIYKIAQPESDELILTIKNNGSQYKLLLSADASLPLVYLTQVNKISPMTAPNFCMLLRKHLQNAKILGFEQPGLERIIRINLEHNNELGDLCHKVLIIEIMGKHSNIILIDENNVIVDSIKHISGMVSSVREVLPGKPYFVASTQDKANPLLALREDFLSLVGERNMSLFQAIYGCYTGISPMIAMEICEKAKVNPQQDVRSLGTAELDAVWQIFSRIMLSVKKAKFTPCIFYENDVPKDFSAIEVESYKSEKYFESISTLLYQYYAEKNLIVRIRQRSSDLRRVVQTALERTSKKYDLQRKQLEDTKKREQYRIYGELLNTYGYSINSGDKTLEALNYYTNEMVTIPLDITLTPTENARKYFDKYNKLKRTFEALSTLTDETKAELEHLETIATSLDIARKEDDLLQIKEELTDCGYIKSKGKTKKVKIHSRPFHYVGSKEFHIYVGKNNYQNDELTFKFANGGDWWFHAKNIPGSHVVVRTEGRELPDCVYEEAAALAAYYSKAKDQDKVEIDYTERKNVKKPAGATPGFVVYYTNFSMMAEPKIEHLTLLED